MRSINVRESQDEVDQGRKDQNGCWREKTQKGSRNVASIVFTFPAGPLQDFTLFVL